MPRAANLDERERNEIRDHLDVTAQTMVKAYTTRQLRMLDWVTNYAIKHSGKYIPVRVDSGIIRNQYIRWTYKKIYWVRRLRVDEIKYIYWKRNKSTKLVEQFK